MCEVATILTASALAIETGAAVGEHIAQNKAADGNRRAALNSQAVQITDISARQQEEKLAANQQRAQVRRQTREAASMARLSAIEAGVSGGSVDALLGDLEVDEAGALVGIEQNETVTLAQLERAKKGVRAETENRIAAVPGSSNFLTGLRVAGAGINAASTLRGRRPTP